MRQMMITVAKEHVPRVLTLAEQHESINTVKLPTDSEDEQRELIVVHLSNRSIGPMIDAVTNIEGAKITLIPYDVVPLSPPANKIADYLAHVERRSPFEVWLNGWQSIGSLKSFSGYALAASIIVWIGIFTNTSFLLVAAMLIAPFAGPAMGVAMATAGGDWAMLRRNIGRYFLGLTITIVGAGLLSTLFGQQSPTITMTANSEISSLSVILPLVAGAAGALNLIESERSSLVAGTAVGMLVAASLAPPAGIVGMAVALGRWDMAGSAAFILVQQLLGINLAGAIVFRMLGLNTEGVRYERGVPQIFRYSMIISAALLIGLSAYQWQSAVSLQRSTIAQRAVGDVQRVLEDDPLIEVIEVNMRFTRANVGGQNSLLGVLYVQPKADVDMTDNMLQQHVSNVVQREIARQDLQVTPLISVNVVRPPDQ